MTVQLLTRPVRVRDRHRRAAAPSTSRHRSPEQRVRQAGGPEDRALYSCACGYAFQAAVSTTVDCPHCGDQQSW